jgi:hypothetical protein
MLEIMFLLVLLEDIEIGRVGFEYHPIGRRVRILPP